MYIKTQIKVSRRDSNKYIIYVADLKQLLDYWYSYDLTDQGGTIFGYAVYKLLCFVVWKPFNAHVLIEHDITAGKLHILLSVK